MRLLNILRLCTSDEKRIENIAQNRLKFVNAKSVIESNKFMQDVMMKVCEFTNGKIVAHNNQNDTQETFYNELIKIMGKKYDPKFPKVFLYYSSTTLYGLLVNSQIYQSSISCLGTKDYSIIVKKC